MTHADAGLFLFNPFVMNPFVFLLPLLMLKGLNADHQTITTMKITIGNTVFTATLVDNPTAAELKKRLPFTITMTELNGNEKYYSFRESFPARASNPRMIENGDLMLYGDDTLVLFYKSFSTSYSYTRLGRIDNPKGLAEALGRGEVVVKFEIH